MSIEEIMNDATITHVFLNPSPYKPEKYGFCILNKDALTVDQLRDYVLVGRPSNNVVKLMKVE